jgi:hypothetical protein
MTVAASLTFSACASQVLSVISFRENPALLSSFADQERLLCDSLRHLESLGNIAISS